MYMHIENYHLSTARWAGLPNFAGLQERLLFLVQDVASIEEKRELEETIAHHWRSIESEKERAIVAYRRLLATSSGSKSHGADYIELLSNLYRDTQNPWRLAQLKTQHAPNSDNPQSRAEMLRSIADLFQADSLDEFSAFDNVCAAFKLSPTPEIQRHLERLAEKTDLWSELASAYELVLEKAPTNARQTSIALRLADILSHKLERPDDAVRNLRNALDHKPADISLLTSLEQTIMSSNSWSSHGVAFYDALGSAIDSTNDIAQRRRLLLKRAKIADQKIDRPLDAIYDIHRLIDGSSQAAKEHSSWLHTLAEKTTCWSAVLYGWSCRLSSIRDRSERANALTMIANLLENDVGSKTRAFAAAHLAFKTHPTDDTFANVRRLASTLDNEPLSVKLFAQDDLLPLSEAEPIHISAPPPIPGLADEGDFDTPLTEKLHARAEHTIHAIDAPTAWHAIDAVFDHLPQRWNERRIELWTRVAQKAPKLVHASVEHLCHIAEQSESKKALEQLDEIANTHQCNGHREASKS